MKLRFRSYVFRCGREIRLYEVEYDRCVRWGGDLEFCLHHCSVAREMGHISNCPEWKREVSQG